MVTFVPALVLAASAALVAPTTAVSAAASPGECNPYTGCPQTITTIAAPDKVERGERAKIKVHVGYDGNVVAKGRVTVTVLRSEGGFTWKDSRRYRGKRLVFRTPTLEKRGHHIVKARFDAKPGTSAKDSDNRTEFRVVKRS